MRIGSPTKDDLPCKLPAACNSIQYSIASGYVSTVCAFMVNGRFRRGPHLDCQSSKPGTGWRSYRTCRKIASELLVSVFMEYLPDLRALSGYRRALGLPSIPKRAVDGKKIKKIVQTLKFLLNVSEQNNKIEGLHIQSLFPPPPLLSPSHHGWGFFCPKTFIPNYALQILNK